MRAFICRGMASPVKRKVGGWNHFTVFLRPSTGSGAGTQGRRRAVALDPGFRRGDDREHSTGSESALAVQDLVGRDLRHALLQQLREAVEATGVHKSLFGQAPIAIGGGVEEGQRIVLFSRAAGGGGGAEMGLAVAGEECVP